MSPNPAQIGLADVANSRAIAFAGSAAMPNRICLPSIARRTPDVGKVS